MPTELTELTDAYPTETRDKRREAYSLNKEILFEKREKPRFAYLSQQRWFKFDRGVSEETLGSATALIDCYRGRCLPNLSNLPTPTQPSRERKAAKLISLNNEALSSRERKAAKLTLSLFLSLNNKQTNN